MLVSIEITQNCTACQCSPVKKKIYGVLYNQSCSIVFDETSSYWSAFSAFHWSQHGSLVSIGQHFGITKEYINRKGPKQALLPIRQPGHVAQSVGHLTRKSGVLGSIPGLATYFRFSFRFFKKGSCQLLAKVCAQSTG